jgi:hypothetical protein
VIRTFDVITRRTCEDLIQSDLLVGIVRWLTVVAEMAGDEGLFRQVPHLRVEGEGTPGLARKYTVYFQQNAVLVKREGLDRWSPPASWEEILRRLPEPDARDLREHFRLARERVSIPVEADHVDRFEWKLGLAIAATFAEARDGLIVTDEGWFAIADTGLVRIDDI